MSKHVGEKCGKLHITYFLSSQRGITPSNRVAAFRGMHVSPAKHSYAWLSRKCDYRTDRHTHTQTDAGQSDPYVPLCFAGDTKIDAKWRHSNLICSTLKQSHVQNFSSICQSIYEKSAENGRTETRTESRTDGRTDGRRVGRTDGHHHTIIRPVWRRAYKKTIKFLWYVILAYYNN